MYVCARVRFSNQLGGVGGVGGGGAGGGGQIITTKSGANGVANTGGGGGGNGWVVPGSTPAGSGGSGLVIVHIFGHFFAIHLSRDALVRCR